jgi:CheY-like chemotaxis protein
MNQAPTQPHVLLIEQTPVLALLTSAELDAAGFEVTLSGNLAESYEWVEALLDPQLPAQSLVILVNIEIGKRASNPLPGLAFVRDIYARMNTGALRRATIIGMVERPTAAIEATAQAAGCYLLLSPMRATAADLLRQIVATTGSVRPEPCVVAPRIMQTA